MTRLPAIDLRLDIGEAAAWVPSTRGQFKAFTMGLYFEVRLYESLETEQIGMSIAPTRNR